MQFDYETIKRLAKASGLRVPDLLALAVQNDPFYVGTPATLKAGEWFAEVYSRAGYGVNRAPHLRRVHYWTVSQDPPILMPNGLPYENTEGCWGFLAQASKAARYLELVPMIGIVDNKNPNPHIHAEYGSTGDPEFGIITPELVAPGVWIEGIDNSFAQPYHLEIWCEKSTMNDVLLPVVERYNANLVTFEGEVSITSVCVNLMGRIDASGGKPARIFYISDFDPAGNSMPVAMSRKLEYAIRRSEQAYDVRVNPIALTADLVQRYRLPRIPIKDTERRAGKFEAAFGTGAVELDALEALYPGVLAQLVGDELRRYYSEQAEDEVNRHRYVLQQTVNMQVKAITDRYADEIEALKGMVEELENIEVDTDGFEVERYAPHVAEGDEWLYDSGRAYIEQIIRYKAHKSGEGNADDAA